MSAMEAQGFRLKFGPGSGVSPEHPDYDASIGDRLPPNWKQLLERIFAAQVPGSAVGTVDPDSVASLGPLWEDILVEEASRNQLTEEDEAARTPAAAALGHSLPGSAVGKKERKIDRKKNFWWRVVCKILKWREFQARFYVASRFLNSGPEGFNWNDLRPKPKAKARAAKAKAKPKRPMRSDSPDSIAVTTDGGFEPVYTEDDVEYV